MPLLVTAVGGLLWMERRLTRIDTLLTNHLAHHEEHDKIVNLIMERLLPRENFDAMARYSAVQRSQTPDRPGAFQG